MAATATAKTMLHVAGRNWRDSKSPRFFNIAGIQNLFKHGAYLASVSRTMYTLAAAGRQLQDDFLHQFLNNYTKLKKNNLKLDQLKL